MSAPSSLRQHLRQGTAPLHDALDARVAQQSLADPEAYGDFLCRQYAARAAIEQFVSAALEAPFAPPPTLDHLIADLADLGRPPPPEGAPFALAADAHPAGLAWAIAGSHLGNRAMLAALTRQTTALPHRFLADPAMSAYWRDLRPLIEGDWPEEQIHAAVRAAQAVFMRFAQAFGVPNKNRLAA